MSRPLYCPAMSGIVRPDRCNEVCTRAGFINRRWLKYQMWDSARCGAVRCGACAFGVTSSCCDITDGMWSLRRVFCGGGASCLCEWES